MIITLITPPSQNIEPLVPVFRSKGVKDEDLYLQSGKIMVKYSKEDDLKSATE
tara:strand:+ start:929 stop:1087 length:159 start_codon:yes stop_codon:yes gene_type:complete